MKMDTSAGVITVNWNGWPDTLECLEAVFRVDGFHGVVVVVDNGSVDGSIEMVCAWAAGNVCVVPQNRSAPIGPMAVPPVPKPITCKVVCSSHIAVLHAVPAEAVPRLLIVDAAENLGFAAANNLGIRLFLGFEWVRLYWLINNDALPDRSAYLQLIKAVGIQDKPLIAGCAIVDYWNPSKVQALGGRFWRYLGLSTHILEWADTTELLKLPILVAVDYPIGAGLVVNHAFIKEYGFMCEDYFLYFEEIDWVLRMGWPSAALAMPRSLVYHKGGATTRSGRDASTRSLSADYYLIRGRLLLARRVSVAAYLAVAILSVAAIVRRAFRPKRGALINAIRATWDGLRGVGGRRDGQYP
jgi:GT2 family glycosyltransferase